MKITAWHARTALIGFAFVLPFVLANFIVSLRIEPFYGFLGAFPAVRSSPIFPLLLLLLFPAGAIVSLYPMLSKGKDGRREISILNGILSALLLAIFMFIFIPLAKDMYKCQILQIPNCD